MHCSRTLALLAVLAALLSVLLAPSAGASSGVRFGIQDDAWLAHGPGTLDDRLDRLERLGVDVVRFNLHWDRIEAERGKPDWRESDLVLMGLRERRIGAVVGLVGSPRWANGGRTPNFAPGATVVRLVRAHCRDSLSLGRPVAHLERAQPGALAAADEPCGLCTSAAQPCVRGDSRCDPGREGRRRRDRSARRHRRRLTRRLDPWDAGRAPRRVCASPLSVDDPRDAVHGRLRPLRDDHDGDARASADRGRARVRAEADLADRVRVPDRQRTASPSSARRS